MPVAALTISGAISFAYGRARTRVKMLRMAQFGHGVMADLNKIRPLLEKAGPVLEAAGDTVDAAAMNRLRAAAEAWHEALGTVPPAHPQDQAT